MTWGTDRHRYDAIRIGKVVSDGNQAAVSFLKETENETFQLHCQTQNWTVTKRRQLLSKDQFFNEHYDFFVCLHVDVNENAKVNIVNRLSSSKDEI